MAYKESVGDGGKAKKGSPEAVGRYLENARCAYEEEEWEDAETLYGKAAQCDPNNIEAQFFTAYARIRLDLSGSDYTKRQQDFADLKKSVSVIGECFGKTDENIKEVLEKICDAIVGMFSAPYVYDVPSGFGIGGEIWQINLFEEIGSAFAEELKKISEKHDDGYIKDLINKTESVRAVRRGCYIATAVYGSYDCPQVRALRRFRDRVLAQTRCGRAFIQVYYTISPFLVKYLGHIGFFVRPCKKILDRAVAKLQADGTEATPYEDETRVNRPYARSFGDHSEKRKPQRNTAGSKR